MKVKIYFNAVIETELDDKYAALAHLSYIPYRTFDKMAADCMTDAEMYIVDHLSEAFDIEAFSVINAETDEVLTES